MRSLLLATLLTSLALAGCSYDTRRPDDADGATATDPPAPPEPEEDNGVLQVTFEAGDLATLEVPFPHLDSCLAPEAWMAGEAASSNATVELRNATNDRTGRVLAVSGQGSVSWAVQIPLGPECNTLEFPYDPWSIDPDVGEAGVEVRAAAGEITSVSVLVRRVRDGCGEATLYDGQLSGDGWVALAGRTIPAGCPG